MFLKQAATIIDNFLSVCELVMTCILVAHRDYYIIGRFDTSIDSFSSSARISTVFSSVA